MTDSDLTIKVLQGIREDLARDVKVSGEVSAGVQALS